MRITLNGVAKKGLTAAMVAAGLSVFAASTAFAASSGPIVIVNPATNAAITTAQASTTQFAVSFPTPAICPGNTAQNSYHVFSYLVPAGTIDPLTLNYSSGLPDQGALGFFDTFNNFVGPINTASSGQVIGLPNTLQWSAPVGAGYFSAADLYGSGTKTWDSGIICVDGTGVSQKYWGQQITFTQSASDPNGFRWTPVTNPPPVVPEVSLTVLLPLSAIAMVGGALVVTRRRRKVYGPVAV